MGMVARSEMAQIATNALVILICAIKHILHFVRNYREALRNHAAIACPTSDDRHSVGVNELSYNSFLLFVTALNTVNIHLE